MISLFKRGYPPRWLTEREMPARVRTALRNLRNVYWAVQHRVNPRHRYHVIRTGLEPGYYDVDHLIETSLVALLRRFVEAEQEGIVELRRWSEELKSDENEFARKQGEDYARIADLYDWFTGERVRRQKALDDWEFPPHNTRLRDGRLVIDDTPEQKAKYQASLRAYSNEETALIEETTEKLKEVVELRGRMWT